MRTDDLIEQIAQAGAPVRPWPRPWHSGSRWTLGAVAYFGLLVAPRILIGGESVGAIPAWLATSLAAAVVSALAAAVAAFTLVVPGASRRVLGWPAAAALVWLGTLMATSLQEGPAALAGPDAQREWLCVTMIVIGSVLPLGVMVRKLRRGAPVAPGITLALSTLAAASLASVSACLAHPHTSSVVLLVWHGAVIGTLVATGAWFGRVALRWKRPMLVSDR
jgi:hypothetical protein